MGEYLTSVICVSLFCSVVKMLLPKQYASMNFGIRLVILCVLLSPLFKWTGSVINGDFVVITRESEHMIDNGENGIIAKRMLARSTAESLSRELEAGILNTFGVKAEVEVPWYEEGDSVLFDILIIKADVSEEKLKSINTWVKLEFSLESRCIRESLDD